MNIRPDILCVTAEAMPGCDVRDAAQLAIALAGRLKCDVRVPFNGTRLRASEGDTVSGVVARWERDMKWDAEWERRKGTKP